MNAEWTLTGLPTEHRRIDQQKILHNIDQKCNNIPLWPIISSNDVVRGPLEPLRAHMLLAMGGLAIITELSLPAGRRVARACEMEQ